jgi:hypothetical protein
MTLPYIHLTWAERREIYCLRSAQIPVVSSKLAMVCPLGDAAAPTDSSGPNRKKPEELFRPLLYEKAPSPVGELGGSLASEGRKLPSGTYGNRLNPQA